MNTDVRDLWLCLHLTGIAPGAVKGLVTHFGGVDEVFRASAGELREAGLSSLMTRRVLEWEKLDWRRERDDAAAAGIRLVTPADGEYPALLREIADPPPVLYVKGRSLGGVRPAVGIVGTRHPSAYGIRMAEKFGYELAALGFVVISGLARGVDTCAHRGALRAAGATVGVMGAGFRHFYPPENHRLGEEMAGDGAVVSEFALDAPPVPENFPRRNRIISGMSKGVLVIEAGQRSGALITAHCAAEQNREVFALPGQVGALTSFGTHQLLKEGAALVETAQDVLEALNLEVKKPAGNSPPAAGPGALDPEEKAVLALMAGETQIGQLVESSGRSVQELGRILVNLELKGRVRGLPGGLYRKNQG